MKIGRSPSVVEEQQNRATTGKDNLLTDMFLKEKKKKKS